MSISLCAEEIFKYMRGLFGGGGVRDVIAEGNIVLVKCCSFVFPSEKQKKVISATNLLCKVSNILGVHSTVTTITFL